MERTLKEDAERWMTHCNYAGRDTTRHGDAFRKTVRRVGAFGNEMVIFEPAAQPGVLVIGARCRLGDAKNARYLALSEPEKARLEERIASHCRSIRAVHRFETEEGRRIIGVYVVLDDGSMLNQDTFAQTLHDVAEMSDSLSNFILKAF